MENRRTLAALRRSLERVLSSTDPREKDVHARQALQMLVVLEEELGGSAEGNDGGADADDDADPEGGPTRGRARPID